MADAKSAMARPTTKMNMLARNQPYVAKVSFTEKSLIPLEVLTHTKPAGPAGSEYDNVLAMEGSSPMIENAMPKTSNKVKFRLNSCL